jgi:hypothetical protein
LDIYWMSERDGYHVRDDFSHARPPWSPFWCEWQMPALTHVDGDFVAVEAIPSERRTANGVVAVLQLGCASEAMGLIAEAQLPLGDDGRVVLVPLPDTGIAASPRASTTTCWLPTSLTPAFAGILGPHLERGPEAIRVGWINPILHALSLIGTGRGRMVRDRRRGGRPLRLEMKVSGAA